MIEMKRIRDLTSQIVREFSPQRVILFGSYAYGNPDVDSDVDLLVVLPFKGKPVRKAIEIRNRINAKVPLDLLVRTPDQIEDRIAKNDWFMREIVEKGRTLYEANHGVSGLSRPKVTSPQPAASCARQKIPTSALFVSIVNNARKSI
jgi:predicted nucleotidyltransferase